MKSTFNKAHRAAVRRMIWGRWNRNKDISQEVAAKSEEYILPQLEKKKGKKKVIRQDLSDAKFQTQPILNESLSISLCLSKLYNTTIQWYSITTKATVKVHFINSKKLQSFYSTAILDFKLKHIFLFSTTHNLGKPFQPAEHICALRNKYKQFNRSLMKHFLFFIGGKKIRKF